jgi:hypothetical protein
VTTIWFFAHKECDNRGIGVHNNRELQKQTIVCGDNMVFLAHKDMEQQDGENRAKGV